VERGKGSSCWESNSDLPIVRQSFSSAIRFCCWYLLLLLAQLLSPRDIKKSRLLRNLANTTNRSISTGCALVRHFAWLYINNALNIERRTFRQFAWSCVIYLKRRGEIIFVRFDYYDIFYSEKTSLKFPKTWLHIHIACNINKII